MPLTSGEIDVQYLRESECEIEASGAAPVEEEDRGGDMRMESAISVMISACYFGGFSVDGGRTGLLEDMVL